MIAHLKGEIFYTFECEELGLVNKSSVFISDINSTVSVQLNDVLQLIISKLPTQIINSDISIADLEAYFNGQLLFYAVLKVDDKKDKLCRFELRCLEDYTVVTDTNQITHDNCLVVKLSAYVIEEMISTTNAPKKTFQSVVNELKYKDAINLINFNDIELVKYTLHHPEADVERMKIYGVFANSNMPFRYSDGQLIPDMRIAPVNNGDGVPEESKIFHEQCKRSSYITLLNSTATGKSRVIFDEARQRYTILIHCSVSDASIGTDKLYSELMNKLNELSNDISINATHSDDHYIDMMRVKAKAYVYAYICTKLLCLVKFINQTTCVGTANVSPLSFLLWQLDSTSFFNSASTCFSTLCDRSRTDFRQIVEDCLQQFKLRFPQQSIVVAFDNAHVAAQQFNLSNDNKQHMGLNFMSVGTTEITSLFYIMEQFIIGLIDRPNNVIISGAGHVFRTASRINYHNEKLGVRSLLIEGPQLPYLRYHDIQSRFSLLLNTTGVDWDNSELVKAMSKLQGRPRLCASVIDKYLVNICMENTINQQNKTCALITACKRAFKSAKSMLFAMALPYVIPKYGFFNTLRTAYALMIMFPTVTGHTLINRIVVRMEMTSLIQSGLYIEIDQSECMDSTITFSEPLTASVIRKIGKLKNWSIQESFISGFKAWLRSSSSSSTVSKHYAYQLICSLALSHWSGKTVKQLIDEVAPSHNQTLPEWTNIAMISVNNIVLKQYDSIIFDLAYLKQTVGDNITQRNMLFRPSKDVGPDWLSVMDMSSSVNKTELQIEVESRSAAFGLAMSVKLKRDKLADSKGTQSVIDNNKVNMNRTSPWQGFFRDNDGVPCIGSGEWFGSVSSVASSSSSTATTVPVKCIKTDLQVAISNRWLRIHVNIGIPKYVSEQVKGKRKRDDESIDEMPLLINTGDDGLVLVIDYRNYHMFFRSKVIIDCLDEYLKA